MDRDARAYLSRRMVELRGHYKDSKGEELHYLRRYALRRFAGDTDTEIAQLVYNPRTHKPVFAVIMNGFVKEYEFSYFYDERKNIRPGAEIELVRVQTHSTNN